MNKYILAIPFYKNEHFIDGIIEWYESPAAKEDRNLIEEVLIYNDFPSSDGSIFLRNKCTTAGFQYIVNLVNIGYLQTVNLAYERAKLKACSLILLNSDTIPFGGFLSEIDQCFLSDSMLGILSARSNNATICNMYDRPHYYEGKTSIEKYQVDRKMFSSYLPDVSYTPVVTGFCFAIRDKVLQAFDGFDEIYTVGYEEENDHCLRISERGFRVGVANKAFVVHMEGKSFGLTSNREELREGNAEIIRNRYPYYESLIDDYGKSLDFNIIDRVSMACANGTRFLIDARVLSAHHNGSNKYIVEIIKAISSLGIYADVIADKKALDFHCIDSAYNLCFIDAPSDVYEFGFMLGQPMTESALWLIPRHSLISVCIFFDTIAHDCPNLRSENPVIDSIWSILPYLYTNLSFISDHSRKQFEVKFGSGTAKLHTHLLPFEIPLSSKFEEYDEKLVFVFGNKFLHKGVDILLEELPTDGGYHYLILSGPISSSRTDVVFLPPGKISNERLQDFMRSAAFILMPSFAEGFGFPLIEALAYNKPIYCREIDCYREIKAAVPKDLQGNIRFLDSFKNFPEWNEDAQGCRLVEHYSTFSEYIELVLNDVKIKSERHFYSAFKGRLLLAGNITHQRMGLPFYIRTLILIYGNLLRTPFASFFRNLKFKLFKFPTIKNILYPKPHR